MPKTTFQKIVFGLLMSVTMAYGMEVYNIAIKLGYAAMPGGFTNITGDVFYQALGETGFMWAVVFLISNLWGNRLGQRLALKLVRPGQDNPFFITLMVSACTVLVMCPSMSAAAALLFNVILGGAPLSQFPVLFIGTLMKNFPMAIIWNLFAAGPLTRLIFRSLFKRQLAVSAVPQQA